ncbi:hypothetical protein QTG54_013711 [Skeletonema marinoi]|uniref:Uncharacterized protein n=1 Tax=Skeletonema marinoi TaxID=267567 RepID=A0AAD8XXK8_9STRA|nr:hypothetical protein QTG54_013711 [Skeletonema marinoi]
MTEQMHYATYGRGRRRRVKLGDAKGHLRERMQEVKSEQCTSSRRKYTQTSRRSKSPTPTKVRRNCSASPTRRRPSVQKNSGKQRIDPVHAHSDRKPRLVKSTSLDARPRQQYKQKQQEFHRQMSGFDFFEEKTAQNSKFDSEAKPKSDNNNKKRGAKFVKSAKSFFKDKMHCVPSIVISGSTCKRYSYFFQSKFQSDAGSICYQSDRENTGTVISNETADSKSSSSSDECSSEGGESIVEREEVDMYSEQEDDSEMSHELGSGYGSHSERLSSLTFSQDAYEGKKSSGFFDDDNDSPADHANDDQIMKFTKELIILLDENEELRGNINDLRKEFEAMLKQMQAIADGNEETFGEDQSIQTDDTRVSHCLSKIDKLKLEALEKFKEVAENHRDDKDKELAKRERDIKSFEVCIEDLLCENERLFNNVVTLSKEREDILKEVESLRQQKQEDHASSDASIAASGCTIPHFMLTDEKEAKCQHVNLDTIALLLKKMKISSTSIDNEDAPTEAEDDIISLVSKIMTQQHHRGERRHHELDLPVVPEDKQEEGTSYDGVSTEGELSSCKEGRDEKSSEVKCDDEMGPDVEDNISEADDDDYSSGTDDDDYISGADDDDFIGSSTCSDSAYDDSEGPQEYEVSADSLLDKKSAFAPNNHGDDSSGSGSLEVIYEYYSSSGSESEGSGSSASVQHQGHNSDSGHKQDVDHSRQDSSQDSDFYDDGDHPIGSNSIFTAEYSFGSIESADYYYQSSRSRSASASRTTRSSSASRARSASRSRSSASRSRSASRPRSSRRDRVQIVSRRHSSSVKRSSSKRESKEDEDKSITHSENTAQEEEITNAINSQLDPMLFNKPTRARTMSTCASISASDSAGSTPTFPSFSSDSTKEHKAITITVVCRSSRHISFPSTREHTFVSFFTVSMRKKKVDAVLEEQLNASNIVCSQNNSTKKNKKYTGEFNEDGQRHGYGIYTSRNGNEYRGEWHQNKREGLGVVKVGNGDVFEGQFESNLKNGVGVYHYQDGDLDLSRYESDHRVGQSLRWSADRQHAFLLTEEPSVKEISLTKAAAIALKMGIVVAY